LTPLNSNENLHRIPVSSVKRRTEKYVNAIESAIARVIESANFILGTEVKNFEQSFAEYIGTKYCIGVANGTDAIELGLRAIGVKPGDLVGTVANAGNYAGTAIGAIGAIPLYMEVDLTSRNVMSSEVSRAIREGVKAIIVTHLYGMAVGEIWEIAKNCKDENVGLLEDCAQAHGAEVNGKKVGSFGDVASFSFYPTKNLGALGDGGAITTSDEFIFREVLKLRTYGWGSKYKVSLPGGRNSRLDEIQAAVLSVFLPMLDEDNERRRFIARFYNENIRVSNIGVPNFRANEFVSHLYVVTTPERAIFMDSLKSMGIETAVHYPYPDHTQLLNDKNRSNSHLPNTELLAREVISLPCFPELTELEIQRTVDAVNLSGM
jgi:aminotransferase EvaB